MRKIYMLTMSLFVYMGVFAGNVNGTIGDNLKWTFTDDGTLTISGTGEMEHADGNSGYAWGTDNHTLDRSLIKKVVVEGGNKPWRIHLLGLSKPYGSKITKLTDRT